MPSGYRYRNFDPEILELVYGYKVGGNIGTRIQ